MEHTSRIVLVSPSLSTSKPAREPIHPSALIASGLRGLKSSDGVFKVFGKGALTTRMSTALLGVTDRRSLPLLMILAR